MTGHKSFQIMALSAAAAVLAAGCGTGDLGQPERAYWSAGRDAQAAEQKGLGVRRRMRRPAEATAQPSTSADVANATGPDRPGEGSKLAVTSTIEDVLWNDKLPMAGPYEGEENLDVRPTLAESFLEQSAERGVWFGIGQALGGGYVSLALFGARQIADPGDF